MDVFYIHVHNTAWRSLQWLLKKFKIMEICISLYFSQNYLFAFQQHIWFKANTVAISFFSVKSKGLILAMFCALPNGEKYLTSQWKATASQESFIFRV